MSALKALRYGVWAAVVALVLAVGTVLVLDRLPLGESDPAPAAIGGPFRLTAHTGAVVDSDSLKGKPFAVFFGFTHCPDMCPTTLAELSGYLQELGSEADRLQVLFVTVDPERDTRPLLADYMQAFDPRILALTGAPAEIEGVLKAYKVHAAKTPTEGGYTVSHTTRVYLMDRQGRFVDTLAYGEAHDSAMQKLRALLQR